MSVDKLGMGALLQATILAQSPSQEGSMSDDVLNTDELFTEVEQKQQQTLEPRMLNQVEMR